MNDGSSPGLDGITTSFFKFFWSRRKHMVIASVQQAYLVGEMSRQLRKKRAVITLIHKGNTFSRDSLSNWRTMPLTNTDYKVLAKCLARRLSTVIAHLVNDDQVGFIKGRKSSDLIRL